MRKESTSPSDHTDGDKKTCHSTEGRNDERTIEALRAELLTHLTSQSEMARLLQLFAAATDVNTPIEVRGRIRRLQRTLTREYVVEALEYHSGQIEKNIQAIEAAQKKRNMI